MSAAARLTPVPGRMPKQASPVEQAHAETAAIREVVAVLDALRESQGHGSAVRTLRYAASLLGLRVDK